MWWRKEQKSRNFRESARSLNSACQCVVFCLLPLNLTEHIQGGIGGGPWAVAEKEVSVPNSSFGNGMWWWGDICFLCMPNTHSAIFWQWHSDFPSGYCPSSNFCLWCSRRMDRSNSCSWFGQSAYSIPWTPVIGSGMVMWLAAVQWDPAFLGLWLEDWEKKSSLFRWSCWTGKTSVRSCWWASCHHERMPANEANTSRPESWRGTGLSQSELVFLSGLGSVCLLPHSHQYLARWGQGNEDAGKASDKDSFWVFWH